MLIPISLKGIKILFNFFLLHLVAKRLGNSIERDSFVLIYSLFLSFESLLLGPLLEYTRVKIFDLTSSKLNKIKLFLFSISIALLTFFLFLSQYQIYFLEIIGQFFFSIPKVFGGSILLILLVNLVLSINFNFLSTILNQEKKYYFLDFLNIAGLLFASFIMSFYDSISDAFFIGSPLIFSNLFAVIGAWIFIMNKENSTISFKYHVKYFSFHFSKVFPLYITFFVGQVYIVLQNYYLSIGSSGWLSNVDYGKKISETAINLVSGVLLSYFIPILSDIISGNDFKKQEYYFNKILVFSGLVFLFSIFATVLGPLILMLIYDGASIEQESMKLINNLAGLFGAQIYISFLYSLFSYFIFFSFGSREYGFISFGTQVFQIVFLCLTFKRLGPYAIPLCFFFAHCISLLYLFYRVDKNYIYFREMSIRLFIFFLFILVFSLWIVFSPFSYDFFALIIFAVTVFILFLLFFHFKIISIRKIHLYIW